MKKAATLHTCYCYSGFCYCHDAIVAVVRCTAIAVSCTHSSFHTSKSSYDKNGTPKYYFSFTNSFALLLELWRRARQQHTRYVSELCFIFVRSFHEFDAVRGVPYIVQSEKYCCEFGSPAKRLCVKFYSEFASYEIQANKMNKKKVNYSAWKYLHGFPLLYIAFRWCVLCVERCSTFCRKMFCTRSQPSARTRVCT